MQQYAEALLDLIPVVAAIGAGYGLARWGGLSAAPLQTLLRLLLFPAVLFVLLIDRVPLETFAVLAGIGAATVGAGTLLVYGAQRALRPRVDPSAAFPNIACFSIPFLALGWQTVGLGTACALFVGAAVASAAVERDVGSLIKQPWAYAVAAAFFIQATGLLPEQDPVPLSLGASTSSSTLLTSLGAPLVTAGLLVLFLLLGVSLHPFGGLKDSGAWTTVAVRLLGGIVVAALAIQFLPMSRGVMEAIVVVALAPPTTKALRFTEPSINNQSSDAAAANVGFLVSMAAMSALLIVNW